MNQPKAYMANHLKLRFIQYLILLLSYVAATVAEPAHPEITHKASQKFVSYSPHPQGFPSERLYRAYLAIQRFKSTITSDPKNVTATWIGHDICGETTYVGFYCAKPLGQDKELTVVAVILNGFGLRAPKLQGFIDQLPDLALFHSASNYFGNYIPYLSGLAYSYNLNVANKLRAQPTDNRLGGSSLNHITIPPCTQIDLNLTFGVGSGGKGSPKGKWFPGATTAKTLLLNYNNLSGPLPANLGFSKLRYLALANNKLTGPIPASIEHAQDTLVEVLLLNNQLSGCLPHELGLLNKAAVIDAGMNLLTGPIPSSFACLSSVEQLNLAGNRLYGEIPDALCKLAVGPGGRLANLTLSSNYFTSVGPACSALIKDGVLDVKNNCIPGFAIQRLPAECASFLSQPKTCPAASTHVECPAAAAKNVVAPEGRVARDYSSYVTYATLHE